MTCDTRILYNPPSDSSTLSVTSAASEYPAWNMQERGEGKWRSTSTAVQTISGTFSGKVPITAFVMYGSNLRPDTTLDLQLSDGATDWDYTLEGEEPIYGFGEAPFGEDDAFGYDPSDTRKRLVFKDVLGDQVIADRFTLTITDASHPDGYFEIRRIMVGSEWMAPSGIEWNVLRGVGDNSEITRGPGGALRGANSKPFDRFSGTFNFIDEGSFNGINQVLSDIGRRRDVAILTHRDDPAARQQLSIVGTLVDWTDAAYTSTRRWQTNLTLES